MAKKKRKTSSHISLAKKQAEEAARRAAEADAFRFKEDYLDKSVEEAQQKRKEKREEERLRRESRRRTPEEIAVRKKRFRTGLLIFVIFIAGLVIVLRSASSIFELQAEKKEAQEEYDAAVKERDQLSEELENVYSREYVEQEARSELRMIYPGETLYIINDSSEDASGEASEETEEPEKETDSAITAKPE